MSTEELGVDQVVDTSATLPTADTAPEESAVSSSIDDAITAAFAKHGGGDVPRDESGRFAPRAPVPQDQQPKATDPNAGDAPSVQPTGLAMPPAWGKADAALWATLPPDVQAKIAAREEQVSQGFKRYEGLAEFSQIAEQNGQSLRQVLTRVRDLEDSMATDPVGTIVGKIMPMFGVRPEVLAAALQGQPVAPQPQHQTQPQPPAFDPRVVSQTVAQEFARRDAASQVEAFMRDPANKYFEAVADTVATLLRSDPGMTLKDAYDQAVWANPTTRAELIKEQSAATAAKAAQASRASTQVAQRAAKSITGSAPRAAGLNGRPASMSIDESIRAAFEAHG